MRKRIHQIENIDWISHQLYLEQKEKSRKRRNCYINSYTSYTNSHNSHNSHNSYTNSKCVNIAASCTRTTEQYKCIDSSFFVLRFSCCQKEKGFHFRILGTHARTQISG